MDYEEIILTVHREAMRIKARFGEPALVVVGSAVHITVCRAIMDYQHMYVMRERCGGATLLGIPYTLGEHVPANYLKVLCETPPPPPMVAHSTAPRRGYDRQSNPRQ